MRRILAIFAILLSIVAGIGAWTYIEYRQFIETPLSLGSSERVMQIPAGTHAKGVVDILAGAGIVENRWMMLYVLKNSGLAERIQPGTIVLTDGIKPTELPDLLARVGKYARLTVQILPGMNIYDIAHRMQENRIADETLFIGLSTDEAFAAELGIPAPSLEGYLAAGAYTFEPGVQPQEVIRQMHERWRSQWQSIVEENRGAYENAGERQMSDHAIVTLASIVEKEAILDGERPVVARVFFNRLRKKMKLQSDPTCVYPPKELGEKPTPNRCKDPDNAYSTYVVAGLPPGPIDTPSQASLRAVLKPYEGPDAFSLFYFVARQDGSKKHYFSKTYAEHQKAVDYYLKKKGTRPRGTTQPKI